MQQTRAWLSVPSSSNRPVFETCLQGRKWPLGPTERRIFHEALQHRCHWVNGLDSSVAWVVLDCGGYGHSQPPGRRHDNGSLARCAPAHVSVACVTCSKDDATPLTRHSRLHSTQHSQVITITINEMRLSVPNRRITHRAQKLMQPTELWARACPPRPPN